MLNTKLKNMTTVMKCLNVQLSYFNQNFIGSHARQSRHRISHDNPHSQKLKISDKTSSELLVFHNNYDADFGRQIEIVQICGMINNLFTKF